MRSHSCSIRRSASGEVPGPASDITSGVIGKLNRGVYTGVGVIGGEVSMWSRLHRDVIGLGLGIITAGIGYG